jgi:hypothetical protein
MRDPMDDDGVQTRIAGQHFPAAARGWVSLHDGADIFANACEHLDVCGSL